MYEKGDLEWQYRTCITYIWLASGNKYIYGIGGVITGIRPKPLASCNGNRHVARKGSAKVIMLANKTL